MQDDLSAEWRKEAARLRGWGAVAQAEAIERCAGELEAKVREQELEAITLDEAVEWSGQSYSTIQKKVASGVLENVGRKHAPRVRRGDLPRKGKRAEDEPSIIDALIAGI
jgi:hypothetical protein